MDFLFDDTIDTSNITNVVLIDSETLNYEIFYNSCNGTTFPIVYSKSSSRNDLLQLLNNKFTKIDRLCFVFSFEPNYQFLNNEMLFRNDETTPYSENVNFIIDLIRHFNISTVDYLACDTLNYENWQNYYNIILTNTTAIVGASNDRTGNILYGGDWTMESTGQDIEAIYFNSNIQNYQNLLDVIGRFSLFIMSNNTIYGCGDDGGGALGTEIGNFVTNSSLVQLKSVTGKTPVSVTSGDQNTIVLMSDGTIFGCGRNLEGQYGNGTNTGVATIVQMTSIAGKTPVSISSGGFFTIVLMSDGTIYGTGANGSGQLGNGNTTNRNTLGVMNLPGGKTPVAISAGTDHSLVLMSDGTIYGTGANSSGQLGRGNTTSSNTLVLMTNSTGKTPSVIYAASANSFVLMTDGTIFGTGANGSGQLGRGNTTSSNTLVQMTNNTGKTPIDLYCGLNFEVVLMSDRTIFGVGINNYGQLGIGNTTNQSNLIQMTNNTGKTPISILAGKEHNMVLMSDGTVYGCGYNSNGQLGNGTTTNRSTLTLMNNNTGLSISRLSGTRAINHVIQSAPTLSNFSVPTKTFGNSPFTITQPTSNSSGSFSYSSSNTSVATISGNTITIVGAGTTTITATQAATTNYTSGTITASFVVSKATPTISSFSIPTKTFGDSPFTISPPTSNSSGSFSYSSSNTSVATISGNTITIVGAGTTTITATQAATTNYNSGTITTTFQVDNATPTISGFSIPTKTVGDSPFTISPPTSNSSGSFSYSSSNTSVADVSGNTITIIGIGTTTITATQAATTNYNSGTITTTFQVFNTKVAPIITGFSIPTKTYSDSPFTITPPTSDSNGSFSYSSSNTSVASISGNIITIVGAGTTNITATQSETTNYTSGTATSSFQVDKATPSITGLSIPTKTYGDSPFTITPPTSNSSGSFSYSSSNTSIATISGNTITIVGAGTTIITATQSETTNYTSGTITTTFQVDKANPSLTGFSIPTKTFGNSPFTITPPTSNSSGSFSYSSSNTSVATISGNTITIVGAGTVNITATQAEATSYTSGTTTASFVVDKANPSITGFSISTKTYGETPFTITPPTSNSNGSFSYSSSNTSIATISGNTITIVGAGTTTITATQSEVTSYTSGTITASFQVDKANPSITGFSIPTKTYGETPFTITPPTSNSSGSFSYSSSNTSIATISGNSITIVGPGTATITVTQAASSNYNTGTQTASFVVEKITPSISSFSLPTRRFGTSPFVITPPTSDSNGTFSYSSSNTSVATVSGNSIILVGAGTATITATQAEAAFYKSGTITASIQVDKGIPSLSTFSIPTKISGDNPFTITPPTSNSSGSFSYSSSNTSVATIAGNTITVVTSGTSNITATQGETSNYTSGQIIASFEVTKGILSISGFSIPTKTYGDNPFTIPPPTSNSNGTFSYISADPSVATVSGNTLTIVGVGTATIIAVQAQTSNYASGTITTSFQIDKATPSISGFSIPTKTYGNSQFTIVDPSSNSNGTFTYVCVDPSVAIISGNTVTIMGVGSADIIAIQEKTTNYTSGIITTVLEVLSA